MPDGYQISTTKKEKEEVVDEESPKEPVSAKGSGPLRHGSPPRLGEAGSEASEAKEKNSRRKRNKAKKEPLTGSFLVW